MRIRFVERKRLSEATLNFVVGCEQNQELKRQLEDLGCKLRRKIFTSRQAYCRFLIGDLMVSGY